MTNTVLKMAVHMDKKLCDNSHKEGWGSCTNQYLSMRITQEKKELMKAIKEFRSPEEIWAEAADIANFAMMLADNYEEYYEDEREYR